MAEWKRGRDIVWTAIAVTWEKIIRTRSGPLGVGEMMPEVQWGDWR